MDRQEGYYWVKYNNEFVIGLYFTKENYWLLLGNDYEFQNSDFEHINENRIKEPSKLLD
jgi:hypothetical protein